VLNLPELTLLDPSQLLFLVFFGFMAAFIDSIVGGGGLISVPALMWTGLPPISVLATNKGAAIFSSVTSFVTFLKSGKMDTWLIKRLFPLALLGSGAGVFTVRLIPPDILRPLVTVMLFLVLIYTLFKKDWGSESSYHGLSRRMLVLAGIASFSLGFYDGFFGPGAGTFYIMALSAVLGLGLTEASADSKVMNMASNIGALVTFLFGGVVLWKLALPGIACTMAGNYVGSSLAIKNGSKFVRPVMAAMIVLLFIKTIYDLVG
jgi:uncharacterized membrane protein YfcA